MLVRRSVLLALAGTLAAAGCKDVEQRDPAPVLALAAFDPAVPILPLPNDLALQGAVGVEDPTRRAGLFQLIDLGGWPPDLTHAAWAPFQGIAVPVTAQAFDDAEGEYAAAAAPTGIDTATIDETTVALVRLSDASPTPIPVAMVQFARPSDAAGFMVFRPVGDEGPVALLAPGRYVFAVRGGPNGVHALFDTERVPLDADRPIALVAPNRDLSQAENRPPRPAGVSPEDFDAQMARLETLRGTFAVGMDWSRVEIGAVCLAALGVTPPEGRCWLPPIPAPPLSQPLPTPGMTAAFAGVDLVFPHEEIASIQTFEVFTPPSSLQEEVTP